MELDFWHERWQRGETGFHQAGPNPYLGYYYGEKGPAPEKRANLRVFVPLCGKSLDMLWLSQNGYSVLGVECSPIAVQDFFNSQDMAYQKIEVSGHTKYVPEKHSASRSRLEILQSDFFALSKADLGNFTDVFDRAALIAMPVELREKYVTKMTELQEPGTRTLLVTLTYPQDEMSGPPFSVSEQEVSKLYGDGFSVEKLLVKNILQDEPRFQERGLTSLVETVYKLIRK